MQSLKNDNECNDAEESGLPEIFKHKLLKIQLFGNWELKKLDVQVNQCEKLSQRPKKP